MMWSELPERERQEYKRMILAFASLTEMFAQKAENGENYTVPSPIINSKYQETVFQRVFHASAEDIGNTSYDASVNLTGSDEQITVIGCTSARKTGNTDFTVAVEKLIYRPKDELYIPIPNAREFHAGHPDFFGPGIGTFKEQSNKLALEKSQCEFNLVFEPSGDCIRSFITQDNGKAIESVEKQSYLGEWILRGVFQLDEFEPLTAERLREIGINGIRLYKMEDNSDVHLQFIWIDEDNLPKDYIK